MKLNFDLAKCTGIVFSDIREWERVKNRQVLSTFPLEHDVIRQEYAADCTDETSSHKNIIITNDQLQR